MAKLLKYPNISPNTLQIGYTKYHQHVNSLAQNEWFERLSSNSCADK